jgi:hypothetical protein
VIVIVGFLDSILVRILLEVDVGLPQTVDGKDELEIKGEEADEDGEQQGEGPGEREREPVDCPSFVISEMPSLLRPRSGF